MRAWLEGLWADGSLFLAGYVLGVALCVAIVWGTCAQLRAICRDLFDGPP